MKMDNHTPTDPQDSDTSHGLLNILKIIFLIAVLAGAWIVLDWLISGK